MIKLELTATQAAYLEAALEKALDNEGDEQYRDHYYEIMDLLEEAKQCGVALDFPSGCDRMVTLNKERLNEKVPKSS